MGRIPRGWACLGKICRCSVGAHWSFLHQSHEREQSPWWHFEEKVSRSLEYNKYFWVCLVLGISASCLHDRENVYLLHYPTGARQWTVLFALSAATLKLSLWLPRNHTTPKCCGQLHSVYTHLALRMFLSAVNSYPFSVLFHFQPHGIPHCHSGLCPQCSPRPLYSTLDPTPKHTTHYVHPLEDFCVNTLAPCLSLTSCHSLDCKMPFTGLCICTLSWWYFGGCGAFRK